MIKTPEYGATAPKKDLEIVEQPRKQRGPLAVGYKSINPDSVELAGRYRLRIDPTRLLASRLKRVFLYPCLGTELGA